MSFQREITNKHLFSFKGVFGNAGKEHIDVVVTMMEMRSFESFEACNKLLNFKRVKRRTEWEPSLPDPFSIHLYLDLHSSTIQILMQGKEKGI